MMVRRRSAFGGILVKEGVRTPCCVRLARSSEGLHSLSSRGTNMLPMLSLLTASAALAHGMTLWPPLEMYPASALAKRLQGQTVVRIVSDADATKTCTISSNSPSSDLDAAACAIILPKINAMAVGSVKSAKVKVRWYIPTGASSSTFDGAIPFDPPSWITPDDIPHENYPSRGTGRTEIGFDVAIDGSVTACSVTASSGTPELDQRLCTLISERGAFLPPIDASGSARVAHATTAVTWFTTP